MKYIAFVVLFTLTLTLTLTLTSVPAHAEGPSPVHILPHGVAVPFKPGHEKCDMTCVDPYELDHQTCACVMSEDASGSAGRGGFPFAIHDGLFTFPLKKAPFGHNPNGCTPPLIPNEHGQCSLPGDNTPPDPLPHIRPNGLRVGF